MTRKIYYAILFLGLMSISIGATAQVGQATNVSVKWGAEVKLKEKSEMNWLFLNSTDEILAVRTYKSIYYLKKYNKAGEIIGTVSWDYKKAYKGVKMRLYDKQLFLFNDQVCIIMAKKDKKAETFYFDLIPIDTKTMKVGKTVKLTKLKFLKDWRLENIGVKVAPDGSKFAIAQNKKGKTIDDIDFVVKVFDQNFEMIWESGIKDVGKEFFNGRSGPLYLDNTGNVIFRINITEEVDLENKRGKLIKDAERHNKYDFYHMTNNGKDHQVKSIEIPVNNITEQYFKINEEGMLIGAGFYSNVLSGMDGSWLLTYDFDAQEIKSVTTNEFTDRFLKEFMSKRAQKKAEKRKQKKGEDITLKTFLIGGVNVADNGDIKIIAEQYYMYVTTYTDSKGNMRQTSHYIYGDIMVICHDNKGKLKWVTPVMKQQHSTNDAGYWNSYAFLESNNKTHIVFTDNDKNLEPKKDKYDVFNAHGKKGTVVSVSIDQNGEKTKGKLYGVKEAKIFTIVKQSVEVNEELIIFAEKGRVHKLATLKYD